MNVRFLLLFFFLIIGSLGVTTEAGTIICYPTTPVTCDYGDSELSVACQVTPSTSIKMGENFAVLMVPAGGLGSYTHTYAWFLGGNQFSSDRGTTVRFGTHYDRLGTVTVRGIVNYGPNQSANCTANVTIRPLENGDPCSGEDQCGSGLYCTTASPRVCAPIPGAPTITFYYEGNPANSASILLGNSVDFSWVLTNANTCTVTGGDPRWTTPPVNPRAQTSYTTHQFNTVGTMNYTISCTNEVGVGVSRTFTVNVTQPSSCNYESSWTPPLATCTYGETLTKTYIPGSPSGCVPPNPPSVTIQCTRGGCGSGAPCTGVQQCEGGVCVDPGQGPGGPPLVTSIPNPLGDTDIYAFLAKALKAFVNLLIPVIVLFYVIAGLMFITARGNPAKLTIAKQSFLYTTIGSAVVLGAWVLAEMISSTIQAIQ